MSFFEELKRRNVVRVGFAYVVVAWLLLQVGDTLAPALRLPDWVHSVLAFFLILGFPLALFFAWAFELTPEGLKKEKDVERTHSIAQVTGRKLDFVIIGLLAVALGYFVLDKYFLASTDPTAETAAEAVPQASPAPVRQEQGQSIAVLPFVNMSDDKDYFADGLSEELLNLLAQIPSLKVSGRTSSFAFKGRNEDLREIGQTLNVATVLEGSVRRSGDRLRVTAQLINVEDGYHIWSNTYDREMTEIFAMQDDISSSIMQALKLHLSGETPTAGPPTRNMEAYQLYLEGMAAENQTGEYFLAERKFHEAVELDPEFALAHEAIASINYQMGGSLKDWAEAASAIRKHAQLALDLDPKLDYARALKAGGREPVWDLEETNDLFRLAWQRDMRNNSAGLWLVWNLQEVGHSREALDVIDQILANDPLYTRIWGYRAVALFTVGRTKEAVDQYIALMDTQTWSPYFYLTALWFLAHEYPEDAARIVTATAPRGTHDPAQVMDILNRLVDPATRDAALSDPFYLGWFGQEGAGLWQTDAFAILQHERFWDDWKTRAAENNADPKALAAMNNRDLRVLNDPRYQAWAETRGLVDYWRKHGLPDFCETGVDSWICELRE